jgi:oligopeptide/dipeptide ABC transporter ATP-binding protein
VESRRQPILLRGEAGDVGDVGGCPFAPRCPAAQPVCTTQEPALTLAPSGSQAACHFPAGHSRT